MPVGEQAPLLSATEEALSRQHLCSSNLSKSILTSSVALLWTLYSTMTPQCVVISVGFRFILKQEAKDLQTPNKHPDG